MRQNYGTQLTRDYLEYLGITDVSKDGTKIMNGDQELAQYENGGYKAVGLYDPAKRQLVPMEERNSSTGQLHVGVHRIVYCWYNRIIPDGMVIDHRNNNKSDNRLENLQLLTQRDNVCKGRDFHNTETKCKMNKPRKFYEDKLAKYEALYEEAKANHNAEACHHLRSNISQTRARLRYWDAHENEYKEYIENKEGEAIVAKELTKDKKDLGILIEYKKVFKEAGNKYMWHQCCKVERLWKAGELNQQAKDHVIDVLLKLRG